MTNNLFKTEKFFLWGKVRKLKEKHIQQNPDITTSEFHFGEFQIHPLQYHMLDVAAMGQALVETGLFRSAFNTLISKISLVSNHDPVKKDEMKRFIWFFLACHDLGKCTYLFQLKHKKLYPYLKDFYDDIPGRIPPAFPHAQFGGKVFIRIMRQKKMSRKSSKTVKRVISCHHGGRTTSGSPKAQEFGNSTQKYWNTVRKDLINALMTLFKITDEEIQRFQIIDSAVFGHILLALTFLSDWIASSDYLYPWHQSTASIPLDTYFSQAQKQAQETLQQIQFRIPLDSILPNPLTFRSVWKNQQFTNLRPLQQTLNDSHLPTGLVIIEAPMGEGKTEAAIFQAMYWLQNPRYHGIYFALPTMATSEQIYNRIHQFLNNLGTLHHLRLIHGMAEYVDDVVKNEWEHFNFDKSDYESKDTLIHAYAWFKPRRRALLEQFAVGTVDQLMLSGMKVRFGDLRLLGLTNKVVIIDEIHAYDAYMSRIILHVIRWLGSLQIPLILLSATLPAKTKHKFCLAYGEGLKIANNSLNSKLSQPNMSSQITQILQNPKFFTQSSQDLHYPLITHLSVKGLHRLPHASYLKSKPFHLYLHPHLLENETQILDLAQKYYNEGQCVCILVNTVARAQSLYSRLKKRNGVSKNTLFLLHARFRFKERNKKQEQVLHAFDKSSLKDPKEEGYHPRPEKAILIATQIVEQSLDLDFDVMISDLAPIDLLLQRMGRIHRHQKRQRQSGHIPELHILLPSLSSNNELNLPRSLQFIYSPFILARTLGVLAKVAQQSKLDSKLAVSMPDDMRKLIEAVYSFDDNISIATPADENSDGQTFNENSTKKSQEYGNFLSALYSVANIIIPWNSYYKKYQKRKDSLDRKARRYLLESPLSQDFLKGAKEARIEYEDDMQDVDNFLNVQTRVGPPQMRILLFDEEVAIEQAFIPIIRKKTAATKKEQQQIVQYNLSIPEYWLKGLKPVDTYTPRRRTHPWLKGFSLLILRNGIWQGKNKNGEIIQLQYSSEYGLTRHSIPIKGDVNRESSE